MEFELEWELKLFREEQPSLFDEVGERYSATPIGDDTAKRMLNIINLLESALAKETEQQSNCNLPDVINNEVSVCDHKIIKYGYHKGRCACGKINERQNIKQTDL